jgi:predicted phosphoribosyltransferase/dienelactone hydrolase
VIFEDRHDAGRRLVAALQHLADARPVVLAVPRGGVPVAVEVALGLGLPIDTITVRKLGSPQNPELAVGAIAEGGTAVFDRTLLGHLGVTEEQITEIFEREQRELERRLERFRAGPPTDLTGRTVLIVDDGLATGLTDLAAVRAARAMGAERVLLAVPVGSQGAVALLEREADEVVCLHVPHELYGVGAWYRDFSPVPDEEVLSELARVQAAPAPVARGARAARALRIGLGPVTLEGDLSVPADAGGLVIFAHGSGSSRLSTRNRHVARTLNDRGLATLLFDLLTPAESASRDLVFDIPLLTSRLDATTRWIAGQPDVKGLSIGLFGASTGAAAALSAAAGLGDAVQAVVSRGGRPDLAVDDLPDVSAPTLLIVGSRDYQVLELNRYAAARLRCENEIAIVEGATHLFEEPGTLDHVAALAGDWFLSHLGAPAPSEGAPR